MSDEFVFSGGRPAGRSGTVDKRRDHSWTVLIVDDEEDVHSVTRMALREVTFRNRGIRCISAYSAEAARKILQETQDIALILLDVVMESEQAGLDLTRWIRDDLKNGMVRIVMRTGQPGTAPERDVIVDYDINDYKDKTELTTGKLFTTVIAGLRSYSDLRRIELSRRGLRRMIETSDSLFRIRSMERFANAVLEQLAATIGVDADGILCVQKGDFSGEMAEDIFLVAGTGRYEVMGVRRLAEAELEQMARDAVIETFRQRRNIHQATYSTLYMEIPDGREMAAFLASGEPVGEVGRDLLEIFASKVSIGFSNITLLEKLQASKETLELRVADRTRELREANQRLEELATRDPLTGAFNRRFFVGRAEAEISRVARSEAPLSLLMIDLDYFKAVNDTHGHGVGDQVLKAMVQSTWQSLRVNDVLGRHGGEEFAVLLPETATEGATEVAERIRVAISKMSVLPAGADRNVTASLGVATWKDGETLEQMISRADSALYAAKRNGRNRVEIAG